MARNVDEDEGAALEERRRVLFHASSLNRSDIIKKVVSAAASNNGTTNGAVAPGSSSSTGGNCDVEREVLDHVDENGLTALHHAVKKSSLDVSGVYLLLALVHRFVRFRAVGRSRIGSVCRPRATTAGEGLSRMKNSDHNMVA